MNSESHIVRKGEGEHFGTLGVNFLWKAKGEVTADAFTVSEVSLGAEDKVPEHQHPYGEVFYVLDGTVEFEFWNASVPQKQTLTAGDTVVVAPNRRHSFRAIDTGVRLLNISSRLHQSFFDAIRDENNVAPFSELALEKAYEKVGDIGQQFHVTFSPPSA